MCEKCDKHLSWFIWYEYWRVNCYTFSKIPCHRHLAFSSLKRSKRVLPMLHFRAGMTAPRAIFKKPPSRAAKAPAEPSIDYGLPPLVFYHIKSNSTIAILSGQLAITAVDFSLADSTLQE